MVEDVIVGIQTSADAIYHLQVVGQGNTPALVRVTSRALREAANPVRELERALLKPLVSGADVHAYGRPSQATMLLFPYRRQDGRMMLIPQDTLAVQYPNAWAYLREFEAALRGREGDRMDHDRWYGYVYPKNLGKQHRAKLGVPRLVDRLRAFYDPDGVYYLDNVDVNGVLIDDARPEDPRYLLTLLNSALLDYIFKLRSVRFQNRFFSANKQFISGLPVRLIPFTTPPTLRRQEGLRGQAIARQVIEGGVHEPFVEWFFERLRPTHRPQQTAVAKLDAEGTWAAWPGRAGSLWEQADVLHDLLVTLSQWREESTATLQAEESNFGRWVAHLLEEAADTRTRRRHLAKLDRLTANDLLRAYRRRPGGELPSPATVAMVTVHVAEYQATLVRLTNERRMLDWLIDTIVAGLYGLTDEQAQVVIESARA